VSPATASVASSWQTSSLFNGSIIHQLTLNRFFFFSKQKKIKVLNEATSQQVSNSMKSKKYGSEPKEKELKNLEN
jgi:hypothetical protein